MNKIIAAFIDGYKLQPALKGTTEQILNAIIADAQSKRDQLADITAKL